MYNNIIEDPRDYKVGIYIRLSQEDADKKYETDSESVINQRNILNTYIKKNNYILTKEYIDDGYSGTNFERPAFYKLIQDIQNKKINMVIVKDLSRLGRDHVLTGYYIETFFPENRVRFISIMENYDSYKRQASNDSSTFIVACNDYYSKQNSYKIRDVLHSKKVAGQFIGSRPAYGYMRDPEDKGHLIPDPETADNVRNIFKWFSSGLNLTEIADKLNSLDIPTPSSYKKLPNKVINWNYDTVKFILKNRIYTGDMVQNKEVKMSYKSKKKLHLNEQDWIIVENTHEPLVDKATFNEINNKGRYTIPQTKTKREKRLLENLFVCKECGNGLTINYRESRDYWSINCNKFTRNSTNNKCVSHYMPYDKLEEEILKKVKLTLSKFISKLDFTELAKEVYKRMNAEKINQFRELDKLIAKRERLKEKLLIMYDDKVNNIISLNTYLLMKEEYETQIQELKPKIEKLESLKTQTVEYASKLPNMVKKIKDLIELKEPTRELIMNIIDKIVVDKDRNVEIFYKFGIVKSNKLTNANK